LKAKLELFRGKTVRQIQEVTAVSIVGVCTEN